MMTAETDERGREAWIASLDKVAALNPKTVVAGHKSVGAPDVPDRIGASQQYIPRDSLGGRMPPVRADPGQPQRA
jgi:hypothetical protein